MVDIVIAESGPPSSAEVVLSPAALVFLTDLTRAFRARIDDLRAGSGRADEPSMVSGRSAGVGDAWRCEPPPAAFIGARVELVGPADTAFIVSALASRASACVADLNDAMLPRWRDLVDGQALLRSVIARSPREGHPAHAALPPILLRPRSLGADEQHVFIDAEPAPAGLVDVGLYCFHNAATLVERGEGPWLSLAKLHGRVDARLWSDIAGWLEERLALPQGTIKLSVRVDTVSALEELDHVLWTLRSRVLAVACGRFEFLRDVIATGSRAAAKDVTPPRSFLTVDRAPLAPAAARIVEICRRRGVPTVGPTLNMSGPARSTFAQVYAGASRHARLGFDGTRVVDAGLVPAAWAALAASWRSRETNVERSRGRGLPSSSPTEADVRENIEIALVHLEGALGGQPRVRLDSFLEDCGSARAARAQLWQWLRARIAIADGQRLDRDRFLALVHEESMRLASPAHVRALLEHICLAKTVESFEEREDRLARELTIAHSPFLRFAGSTPVSAR